MNVQYPPSHSPTHLPEGSRFWLVAAATLESSVFGRQDSNTALNQFGAIGLLTGYVPKICPFFLLVQRLGSLVFDNVYVSKEMQE